MKKLLLICFIALTVAGCESIDDMLGTTNPEIVKITPYNEQYGVAPAARIIVEFSKDMDDLQTNESFSLSNSSGAVYGIINWENSKTMVFTPYNNLELAKKYKIVISNGAEDSDGVNLENSYSSVFYVGTDIIAPVITGIVPADNVVGVAPTANISITFSEPVNPDTVVSGISISPTLNGQYLLQNGNATVVFDPVYDMAYGTTYTVTVTTGVTDVAGNKLKDKREFHFTVGDDFVKPTITGVQQALPGLSYSTFTVNNPWLENTINYCARKNSDVIITFSEQLRLDGISSSIKVTPATSFSALLDAAGTSVVLSFYEPLDCETEYTVSISSTYLTDLQSNKLAKDYIYKFYTNDIGSVCPKISEISSYNVVGTDTIFYQWPLNDIAQLYLNELDKIYENIRVTFSVPMDPATVSVQVDMITASITPKITNVVWQNGNTELLFTITDLEGYDVIVNKHYIYSLTIKGGKTGSKDANGNYIKENIVQYFRL